MGVGCYWGDLSKFWWPENWLKSMDGYSCLGAARDAFYPSKSIFFQRFDHFWWWEIIRLDGVWKYYCIDAIEALNHQNFISTRKMRLITRLDLGVSRLASVPHGAPSPRNPMSGSNRCSLMPLRSPNKSQKRFWQSSNDTQNREIFAESEFR